MADFLSSLFDTMQGMNANSYNFADANGQSSLFGNTIGIGASGLGTFLGLGSDAAGTSGAQAGLFSALQTTGMSGSATSPSSGAGIGSTVADMLGSGLGLGTGAAAFGAQGGQAASDTLAKLSFSRVATVLAGLLLVGFGLYYFGSSTLADSLTSAVSKLATKGE